VAQDRQLRKEILGLPLYDEHGRRLRYATPVEVENNGELGQRWAELEKRVETEGSKFRLTGVDKKLKDLVDAYGKFRLLTYNPNTQSDTARRFYTRVRSAAGAWRKLAGALQSGNRVDHDAKIRELMVQAGEALQKVIAPVHGGEFSREMVETPAAALCRAGEQLAARLADSHDKPLAALAADLRRQTAEMHMAMYDNGETLRFVPALNPGAFEENRTPGDDASPWLSFQAMLFGSDDLLRSYPQPELKAVRKTWADVKGVYLDREAADRPAKFAAAMNRFAEAVRTLAEQIEPLRQRLPFQHADQDAIDATAYPPLGSTDAEVFYNQLDPFFWAWVVSLAATLCLLLAVGRVERAMFWLGIAVLVVAQVFTAAGMGLRGYITGLVPLTGMFETVVFVALYAALLGLWFALSPCIKDRRNNNCRTLEGDSPIFVGRKSGQSPSYSFADPKLQPVVAFQGATAGRGFVGTRIEQVLQRRPFAVAGAIVSFTALVLAYYAPATVMHRHIGAVAPILRDNFWLAVHVVTIMASYASAAIALILGNIALGYYLFGRYTGRRAPAACTVLAGFTYTAIQITVLLLAAGTILGALWADKAWGRFWAWDPKEVWALISLLVYIVILHARYIGWSGDFAMTVAAVLGATAVLFTWYGVNFLLGSGMHSYGSGAGGQWAVGTAVAIQWLFLAAAGGRYLGEGKGMKDEG
jgi:ABC-type transport system involved in cytochrome c biogenesis permease subunit